MRTLTVSSLDNRHDMDEIPDCLVTGAKCS